MLVKDNAFNIVCYAFSIAVTALVPSFSFADPTTFKGHVKAQFDLSKSRTDDLNSQFGENRSYDQSVDLRFNFARKENSFDFNLQTEGIGRIGDKVATEKKIAENAPAITQIGGDLGDRTRLFDLSQLAVDDENAALLTRVDRAAVGYTTEAWVGRVGRQAVTWGNGLAFQVMDFFNPFSPTAIDKDYKTGDDLIYQQFVFDGGDDLQMVVVPRRDIDTHEIESAESTYSAKYRGTISSIDLNYDVMSARHYDADLFGLGFMHNLFEAVWRFDFVLSTDGEENTKESFVTNMDRSWEIFGRNVYTFIEYYRNGFGTTSTDSFPTDQNLLLKLSRGDVFTIGRNEAAFGVRIELEPRYNLFLTDIYNLNDNSGYFQVRNEIEVLQDFLFTFGVNLPYGGRGSEFGGLALAAQPLYVAPSKQAYIKFSCYW